MTINFSNFLFHMKVSALILVLMGALFAPGLALGVKPTCPGHPSCKDDSSGDDPVQTVPAFAYYCKSNPNVGAICLASEDGSAPVKIFDTGKFHGDRFQVSAVLVEGSGSVLVEDYGVLSQIDFTVTSDGVLDAVSNPDSLTTGVGDVDWNPDGSDFVFHDFSAVFLGSRAMSEGDQRGAPIVESPVSPWDGWNTQLLRALSWSHDGTALYITKSYMTDDGPWWDELHKADLGVDTPVGTTCLLATSEAPYKDTGYCARIEPGLSRLSKISDHQNGLMVAGSGVSPVGEPGDDINFIFILDGSIVKDAIPTPGFLGFDWTTDGRIISQTDDDEIIVFDPSPESGEIEVLLNKNATSPDWVN